MRGEFDFPSNSPLVGEDKRADIAWLQTFARWHRVILAAQQSGTTANRPTSLLWVGRRYFDTTLGKPIWLKTASPVVWVTADGVVA